MLMLVAANVDEVFIDLCRQIIRKDNTTTTSFADDDHAGYGAYGGHDLYEPQVPVRTRRRGRRKKSHCTIL